MFSLQKLFSKDQEFFDLLEVSGEECRASVKALQRLVANRSGPLTLDDFIASRRRVKQVTGKITELLSRVSVTAFEREDIESLCNSLYKIPKTVEKFAERYILSATELRDMDFSKQVQLLEQAIEIIVEMLKALQDPSKAEKIGGQNERLQQVEGDADKLMLTLLSALYRRRDEPVTVIMLKDLYELLEKIVDRCRDAGNVISNINLKNS